MPLAPATPRPSFLVEAAAIVAARPPALPLGVHFGGMEPDARKVETVEDVAGRLERQEETRRQWRLTPRGRFYLAIRALEDAGFHDQAYKLQGAYDRGISAINSRLDVKAVAACLAIFNGIENAAGREGVDACAELLLAERPVDLKWAAE